jgi:ATP-binding cassette subfamily G (WHITE) protein 2
MVIGFAATQNIILLFPEERAIFLREVNNNMYSPSAYFFGKVISEFPTSIIIPFAYAIITYFAIDYSRVYPWNFPMFVGILIMIYSAASSYALIIGACFSDKQVAMTLIPVVITPLMLFAGYFVSPGQIPIWLVEFEYISFFKYGY